MIKGSFQKIKSAISTGEDEIDSNNLSLTPKGRAQRRVLQNGGEDGVAGYEHAGLHIV